ncbi:hypothetical protein THAOC_17710 [Thalassiosira oceanica]|uniref:Uncharacterized protein n=1 Tax=Thalassiosira oceanica TaxID=159749 RepID=K0S8Z3_THAOC|nr:hypothetical protein THAOC_17710 [Thalassiosira oceanica]|eukprot:EJK61745.1 hypothetical protein THAOC_17710 [Thalassiosira oceanica]
MNPMGDQLKQAASQPDVFLLYEGGEVAEEFRSKVTHVRVAPHVRRIPDHAFEDCDELIGLQLNEGLQVIGYSAFEGCMSLRSVTLPSSVTEIGQWAFSNCGNLVELQLKEGLQVIGARAFYYCSALRSVTLPSSVTELSEFAFHGCSNLAEVRLNNGLRIIGDYAFKICTEVRTMTIPSTVTELGKGTFGCCRNLVEVHLNEGLDIIDYLAFECCSALRSVTIPSTVTELCRGAFRGCSNLSEVIVLGGKRLLNREFVECGFKREEQELLNQEALDEMLFDEDAFHGCPLTTVKISISWAISERIERLLPECRVPVSNMILNLRRLDLKQDGNILACFPVIRTDQNDENDDGTHEVLDTNLETARSLYQVLQLIAFHELKESSILIELAFWKSTIDKGGDRAWRVVIPGPAKILLMEYCGFAGFLRPAF